MGNGICNHSTAMGRSFVRSRGLLAILSLGIVGCVQSDFGDQQYSQIPEGSFENAPGDSAWGRGDYSCDDLSDCSCESDEECGRGEVCLEGICQKDRCSLGPYLSVAPLGPNHYFFRDRELLAVTNSGLVQRDLKRRSFGPASGKTKKRGIVDVAGGHIFSSRPEEKILALENDKSVYVFSGDSEVARFDVGFVPIAISAGDIDQDGTDEVIALAANAEFAICRGDTGSCELHSHRRGSLGIDVASGDIDGDTYEEPVFLLRSAGEYQIHAYNFDAKKLNQKKIVSGPATRNQQFAIAAADTDGDRTAEIFTLEESGLGDYRADRLVSWKIGHKGELSGFFIDSSSKDIIGTDTDKNGTEEIALLHDASSVTVFRGLGRGELASLYSDTLGGTVHRIAAADIDGDSPIATRIDSEPELVAGELVPLIQVHWPPYPSSYSKGGPYVYVGETKSTGEFTTDVVSLYSSVEVAYGGQWKGFGLDFSTRLRDETRIYERNGYDHYIGHREVLLPDAGNFGTRYSVVVVANTCYHSYRYELEDPNGSLGGTGREFALLIPVGGRSKAWSSERYNAYARAVGGMPEVDGTFELGSVKAYPNTPQRSDGTPITEDEMVFASTPTVDAGDAGRGAWWLSARDFSVKENLSYQDVSVRGNIKVAGMRVTLERNQGDGHGTGIYLGDEVLFGGAAPPIPDNPATPEDEYEAHGYTFRPFVYQQKYDIGESKGAYYVLTYTVGE